MARLRRVEALLRHTHAGNGEEPFARKSTVGNVPMSHEVSGRLGRCPGRRTPPPAAPTPVQSGLRGPSLTLPGHPPGAAHHAADHRLAADLRPGVQHMEHHSSGPASANAVPHLRLARSNRRLSASPATCRASNRSFESWLLQVRASPMPPFRYSGRPSPREPGITRTIRPF